MNENKRLKIWIVILCCLLVLFGSYIFYLEFNKGSNTKVDNTNNSEVKKDSNSDVNTNGESYNDLEKLSDEEVYNLVTKYTDLGGTYNVYGDKSLKYYFGDSETSDKIFDFEELKLFLAINNAFGTNVTDCENIKNKDFEFDGSDYGLVDYGVYCFENGNSKSYSYTDVNSQYKHLFGSSADAPKKSVHQATYYYFDGIKYVSLFAHDPGLWPDGLVSKITDFTQANNELTVTVSYLYDIKFEDYTLLNLTQEETNEYINKIFNERTDYSHQYKLEFEYEIDHFILKNIIKVK